MELQEYQYFYEQSIERSKALDSKIFAIFTIECALVGATLYFAKDITLKPTNLLEFLFLATVCGTLFTYVIAITYLLKAMLGGKLSYIDFEELNKTITTINSLRCSVSVENNIVDQKIYNTKCETYLTPIILNKEYNYKKDNKIAICISWTFICFCLFILSLIINIISKNL